MNRTQILTMCWCFNIFALIPFIIRDNVAFYNMYLQFDNFTTTYHCRYTVIIRYKPPKYFQNSAILLTIIIIIVIIFINRVNVAFYNLLMSAKSLPINYFFYSQFDNFTLKYHCHYTVINNVTISLTNECAQLTNIPTKYYPQFDDFIFHYYCRHSLHYQGQLHNLMID